MVQLSQVLHRLLFSPRFLCVAFFGLLVLNLGLVPLLDVDEGAFSEATREMVASGVYAATYLDGVPRYDKPILIYWFQALSVHLLGVNEWAFRLPSVLFSALWLLAVGLFAREFLGKSRAMIACFVLLTCVLFAMVGRAAFADAPLNLWLSLTLFDIYRYAQNPRSVLIYRVYLWMALGMLTKGPVAVAIPLLVSVIFFLKQRQIKPMLRAFFHPAGWVLFLILLVPWLWLVYQEQGAGFFKGFLIDHNLKRFTMTKEGHGGQWYYYLVMFPVIVLPFSGLLWLPFKRFKAFWHRPLPAFLLIWLFTVVVIFSFSDTQLPHYVMNAATPFCLLVALYAKAFRDRFVYILPSLMVMGLLLLLPVLAAPLSREAPFFVREMLSGVHQVFTLKFYLAGAFVMIAMCLIHWRLHLPLWGKLVWSGLLQSVFVYYALLPALSNLQQVPVKEAALLAKAADARVVRYRITMPSFSVYREAITEKRLPVAGEWVFTRAGQGDRLRQDIAPLVIQERYAKGGVRLFEVVARP